MPALTAAPQVFAACSARRPARGGAPARVPAQRIRIPAGLGGSFVCRSSSLGSVSSLFEKRDTNGSSAGGAAKADEALAPIPEVPLESDLGVDYTLLRDKLAAGEWELADNETRRLLCEIAGEEAQLREWVYFTEVKFIPVKDMLTLDRLWRAYSRDRYGYSVQRALWIASKRQWGPFFKRINWTTGENNAYRKWPTEFLYKADAEKGHLPLTNALRGTQLFQAVMEHEAFGGPVVKQEPMVWGTGDKKSWLSGGMTGAYSGEPPTLGLGLVVQLAALILFAAASAQLFQPNF